jgi:hypothetical protein
MTNNVRPGNDFISICHFSLKVIQEGLKHVGDRSRVVKVKMVICVTLMLIISVDTSEY